MYFYRKNFIKLKLISPVEKVFLKNGSRNNVFSLLKYHKNEMRYLYICIFIYLYFSCRDIKWNTFHLYFHYIR